MDYACGKVSYKYQTFLKYMKKCENIIIKRNIICNSNLLFCTEKYFFSSITSILFF